MQISPIKAFFVLLGALAAIAALVFLTRPQTPTIATNASAGSADHSLTNEEAIARFKELKKLRDRAFHEREASLVPLIYTSDSPRAEGAIREIRKLQRDKVLDRTRFITREIRVAANRQGVVTLIQEEEVHPKFTNESGEDITQGSSQHQVIKWTLHLQNDKWLVYDTVVQSVRRIPG